MARNATAKAATGATPAPAVKQTDPAVSKSKSAAAQASADNKAKAEASTAVTVPKLNPDALSVDVAPRVLSMLTDAEKAEQKLHEQERKVEGTRYAARKEIVLAMLKAAAADTQIDLHNYYRDTKAVTRINEQIGLALGWRAITTKTVGKGDKMRTIESTVYSPSVSKFFPSDKDGPTERSKKTNFRTNFLHLIKECGQAAATILAEGMKVEEVPAEQTLMLTGPAVEKHFGVAEVVLNEKQVVPVIDDETGEQATDTEGKPLETKLSVKPSLTAIAKMGAAKRQPQAAGSGTGKAGAGKAKEPPIVGDAAFVSLCETLLKAINRIEGRPTDKQKRAMEQVANAIEAKL